MLLADLDHRGAWARRLRDLIADHTSDLGGDDAGNGFGAEGGDPQAGLSHDPFDLDRNYLESVSAFEPSGPGAVAKRCRSS